MIRGPGYPGGYSVNIISMVNAVFLRWTGSLDVLYWISIRMLTYLFRKSIQSIVFSVFVSHWSCSWLGFCHFLFPLKVSIWHLIIKVHFEMNIIGLKKDFSFLVIVHGVFLWTSKMTDNNFIALFNILIQGLFRLRFLSNLPLQSLSSSFVLLQLKKAAYVISNVKFW